jgi:hypothetical protein
LIVPHLPEEMDGRVQRRRTIKPQQKRWFGKISGRGAFYWCSVVNR